MADQKILVDSNGRIPGCSGDAVGNVKTDISGPALSGTVGAQPDGGHLEDKMRDPDRIDRILVALGDLWKTVPDWRLGQVVSNLLGPGRQDVFFTEDDEWERLIKSPDWRTE